MDLNRYVQEYSAQLAKGHIQKAYRGIMSFMSDLKTYLESVHPDYATSALYPGYMDMTYFAITPPALKKARLKIAIVFLHQEGRFEVWLAANNRQVQAEYIERLRAKPTGSYLLSEVAPGVDSILSSILVAQPDFDHPDELKAQIQARTLQFTRDMMALLSSRVDGGAADR